MSENEEALGSDLSLSDLTFGADLSLTHKERGVREVVKEYGDLNVVSGALNLGQAITSRLRTRRGEIAELGFPDYGSRLHEYVGEPNDAKTREELRLVVLEALAREPRVKEVVNVTVKPSESDPNGVIIEMAVIPLGGFTPLSIVYPFYLEVA
jgi:phage baseplate assembly protein W